ncbi:putative endo-beta-N-acetylglucosaminidase precursor [compost metagenome]
MKPIHKKILGLTILSVVMGDPTSAIALPFEKDTLAADQLKQEQIFIRQLAKVDFDIKLPPPVPQVKPVKIAKEIEQPKPVEEQPQQPTAEELFIQFQHKVKKSDVTTLDLTIPSGLTTEQADDILKGTGLEGLGKDFVDAEIKHKVNAYYLIAHAAWESGWGESKLSKNKNNLFGFAAYDDSPYSSAMAFTTKGECIDTVAEFIQTHYLQENGDHYNGPNLKGMNIKYATDENWAKGIAQTMVGLIRRSNSDPI